MSQFHQVNFSLNQEKFLKQLRNQKFTMLKVSSIPKSSKVFELLCSSWFISEVLSIPHLFVIKLKVEEKIDEHFDEIFKNQLIQLSAELSKQIVIVLVSKVVHYHCKFYWKASGCENFYSVNVNKGNDKVVGKYLLGFLIREIKSGKSGILRQSQDKDKFELKDIGNFDGRSLLTIAVSECFKQVVRKLLKYKFSLDHKDSRNQNAIDVAWVNYIESSNNKVKRRKYNKIILMLLEANSKLPGPHVGFEMKNASKEVHKFIRECENFHEDDIADPNLKILS
ncbi:hypothetical protein ACKWTF_005301 [Chironomus riparius]